MTTFTHAALLHDSDDGYLAGALPFLHAGLEAGEACIVLTDPANERLLRANLPSGAVEFGEPATWYSASPGAMLATLDRCFTDHERAGRRVRILGGVRWHGLEHLARRAWQRYEAALNAAFTDRNAALLCTYDARRLDDSIVATARCTHPAINDSGTVQPSVAYTDAESFCADYDREQLPVPVGEVDGMKFDASKLAATRAFTAEHARAAGLGDDRISDLVLAVGEITANVVRHASGHGHVESWREDGRLVFEVVDDGICGPVPLAGWLPPPPGSTNHMGLWLARQLVDLVETRYDNGWQVRLYTEAGAGVA